MLRIGTAGWALPAQARERFPDGDSHLARYASVLNCVEINSSFHRPHKRSTYERWAATVPGDFRFSLKLPKAITHVKRCEGCYDDVARFIDETASLGNKRAAVLVQFPPTFQFELGRMERFFADLRSLYDGFLVCEPRHASWFAADAGVLLRDFKIGRVAADPAPEGSDEAPGGWRGIAYLRLHGAPRVYYSRYEKEAVESIAKRLVGNEAPERWCIFDNTAAGAAIENALELVEQCRILETAPGNY
jgi:uncharacterized protein YecE (DUF72 family)